jgi:hypothetical protein
MKVRVDVDHRRHEPARGGPGCSATGADPFQRPARRQPEELLGTAADGFQKLAAAAKENCPLSKALRSVAITLEAKLNP